MTAILNNASLLNATRPLDVAGNPQAKAGNAVADATKASGAPARTPDAHEAGSLLGNVFVDADAATVRPKIYDALHSILAEANGVQSENAAALAGQIRDNGIASEIINLAKSQILNQSGPSALGQANKDAQAVLSLLK